MATPDESIRQSQHLIGGIKILLSLIPAVAAVVATEKELFWQRRSFLEAFNYRNRKHFTIVAFG